MTHTAAKIRLIRSVKVWNPPQLNLRILDLRTNTNLRRLATRTIHEQIRRVISASFSITPSFHINNIVKVVLYHLRNIAEIRKYMNVTTAEVLVNAFINSKLDFCNSLLHGLSKYEINKLQSVQNAAARVIACLRKFDHISDTLKELHWLPVEQRIIFKINLIFFKVLFNLAPDYLVDLIPVFLRAFSVIAPIPWNDLPIDIRSLDDVNKFKSKLKTFLFKRVYKLS